MQVRAIAIIATVLGLAVCTLHGAAAQVGSMPAPESRTETDVFTGRNVVGPYFLGWKAIVPDSERVTRNGLRLARGSDYQINAAAGVVTFSRPLRSTDIARVDYRISAGTSHRNPAQTAIPLGLTLFADSRNLLSLDAVYRPSGDARSIAATNNSGGLDLSLSGNFRHSATSTGLIRLFLDQRGGRLTDRGAIQLSEKGRFRYGQYAVSFARAGHDFGRQAETGLAAGRQVVDAQLTLKAARDVQSTSTFQHTTDLPAFGTGASTISLGQRLSAATPFGTRLAASYLASETSGLATGQSSREVLRVQAEQTLPGNSSASALLERVETTAGGTGRVLQTSSLDLRSAPTPSLSLLGRFSNRLMPSGPEDFALLRLEAEPGSRTRLSAEVSDRYSPTHRARARAAGFSYGASPAVALQGGLAIAESGNEQSVAGSFGAVLKPSRPLELSGAVKLRERTVAGVSYADEPDTLDVRVRMELARKALQLTGGISANPEDEKGNISRAVRQTLGWQSTFGGASVSGGYSVETAYTAALVSRMLDLKLGVNVGRYTSIYGTFKGSEILTTDLRNTDEYGIGLVHRFGDRLDLTVSGAVTNRYLAGALAEPPLYRAETRLRMRF